MQLRLQCEFYLLQYVPDPVRNEFVHIGVVLREAGGPIASVKFTSDWRRVRCVDPDADVTMLEELGSELSRRFEREPEGNLLHVLEDSFSNSVQMTRSRGYLAESVTAGVEELMRMYVEPHKRDRTPRLAGRAAIQARMRSHFEQAGVWDLLRKKIAASEYTRAGDPLRIDVGYRSSLPLSGVDGLGTGGVIRMFQAVSLEGGAEMAKVLAFSANSLIAGVQRIDQARLELTAIVEPLRQQAGNREKETQSSQTRLSKSRSGRERLDDTEIDTKIDTKIETEIDAEIDSERADSYRFAKETMESHRIRVFTTADLGRVAETARRELRV